MRSKVLRFVFIRCNIIITKSLIRQFILIKQFHLFFATYLLETNGSLMKIKATSISVCYTLTSQNNNNNTSARCL